MTNQQFGTLYIGVTNDLIRRVDEHRNEINEGFTKQYSCKNLVYYEVTDSIYAAMTREKQLKNWKRTWKIELIEKENKSWEDLYDSII